MIGFTRQIAQERWSNPALFSLAEGLPRTALQLRVGPRNQGMSSYAIVANSSPPLTVSANDLPLPYSAFISIDLDGGFVTNGQWHHVACDVDVTVASVTDNGYNGSLLNGHVLVGSEGPLYS